MHMVICCYIKDVFDTASLPQVLSGLRFYVLIPVYTNEMGNNFQIIFIIFENIKDIKWRAGIFLTTVTLGSSEQIQVLFSLSIYYALVLPIRFKPSRRKG